jgi:hypothetical protein
MEKKRLLILGTTVAVLSTYWACGLNDPKYVNYVEEVPANVPEPPSGCEAEALALFTSNINDVLAGGCGGGACHVDGGSVPISGITLSDADVNTNYGAFKAYTGADPAVLYGKISTETGSHGGGDKSGAMPLEGITEWTDKEAECAAG